MGFSRAELEANAKKWANHYQIWAENEDGSINYNPNARGDGDARDAFRHSYTTAEIKRELMKLPTPSGISQQTKNTLASKAAYGLGEGVELINGNNYNANARSANDLNMDLWNDAKGSQINSSSEAESARKVKELLDKNDLITQITDPDPRDVSQLTIPGTNEAYSEQLLTSIIYGLRYLSELYEQLSNDLKELWEDLTDFINDPVGIVASAVADAIEKAASSAITLTPIALDLNGNGRIDLLSATATNNKVFFDIDNININATNDNFAFDKTKMVG
jgi:hypothetical protein